MPLEKKLQAVLERALRAVDEAPVAGPRLIDDAGRLWNRAKRLLALNLVDPTTIQPDAMELACFGIHLPLKGQRVTTVRGKLGRPSLKERAEQTAEILVNLAGDYIDEPLLDRTTRILHEIPHRKPAMDEARLLADAINLEDFSIAGLFVQAIELTRTGDGLLQLVDGVNKREQYGYWDARLKDGFHFEPVRKLARQRLDHVRRVANLLTDELSADGQ